VHSRSFGKLLIASPLLALPLFVVPALCFALNRASFVWSLVVIGLTGWRWHWTRRDTTASEAPAKGALSQLVLATCVIQMLAFAWIGAVWMLEGIGRLIILSPVASRVVAWIQAQWFAELAAWLVLFAVVCGLFRLGRPLLAWHQRAVRCAVTALPQRDPSPPTALPCPGYTNDSGH
jgi:hypothetical protein